MATPFTYRDLDAYVELSWRLGFLSAEARRRLAISDSVGRLLNGLHRALSAKVSEP
jgi:hypothetical protein